MKLTVILLLAAMMQVSASSFGQKVTLDVRGSSLKQVFAEIKKQTGLTVFYSSKDLKNAVPVNASLNGVALAEAMKQILSGQELDFTINEKTIVIKAREEKGILERFREYLAQITVTGKVVDETGQPIGGASVLVKATGKGIGTKADGTFALSGIEDGEVLVVKFIGYEPKEVIAAKELGMIRLKMATNDLDAVQIQAYGTTSRRLTTSNISTIKAEDIEKQPINNPLLALAGKVPGVTVFQSTGTPGSTVVVRIQGATSLRAGVDPFYVVDGVPYDATLSGALDAGIGTDINGNEVSIFGFSPSSLNNNTGQSRGSTGSPFSFINPADIESIDVLKDADATAIYGSRAANGAIIITTKRGKVGDFRINLNLNQGFSQVANRLDLLNNKELLAFRYEAKKNANAAIGAQATFTDYDLNGLWDPNTNNDWQEILYGKSTGYTNTNLSFSGGNINTQYRLGFMFNRQGSPLPKDISSKDIGTSLSLNARSKDQKFKIDFLANYFRNNSNLQNVDLSAAIMLSPMAPAFRNPDGTLNWAINPITGIITRGNSFAALENALESSTHNLIGNASLSYELFKGLQLRSSFGYTYRQTNSANFVLLSSIVPYLRNDASRSLQESFSTDNTYSIEPQITYHRQFGRHQINALVGGTFQDKKRNGLRIFGSGMPSDELVENIAAATEILPRASDYSQYKYNAFFGRINYDFRNRYILNFTARRDGSSRFGTNNRFANFYAIGGAWIFSEETYLKENLTFLSFGKLKMSYGTTGNDQIGDYTYLDLLDIINFGQMNYQSAIGLRNTRFFTPSLQWERTKKINVGLDLGFIKDRLLIGVNYAINTTSNMLQDMTLPNYNGLTSVLVNFPGTLRMNSLELSLNTVNVKAKNFTWESNFNYTFSDQKLTAFPDASKLVLDFANRNISSGQPITSIRTYKYYGIDPLTGRPRVSDKNGNPTESPIGFSGSFGTVGLPEDATEVVDISTRFNGGINNTFNYKDVNLSVDLQYVNRLIPRMVYTGGPYRVGQNVFRETYNNTWHFPGDVARFSRVAANVSDNFLRFTDFGSAVYADQVFEDGSFLRIRNVALSWALPKPWASKLKMKSASISIRVQNLLTITGYSGLDPESQGTVIPPLRTFTFGINTTF